jgi:hypothetical protein
MIDEESIRRKFEALGPAFAERTRRLWVATEAKEAGYGGIAAVTRATGISSSTVKRPASIIQRFSRDIGGERISAEKA